jgi:AcrR family transcriptional regulator
MVSTPERLVDAAIEVLLRDGARALTLAAVARSAGVSKGGLLYHFPSKPALVAGMVERLVSQFDAALAEAGDAPGAATRAYLAATVRPVADDLTTADRASAALFAAALVDPDALAPLRDKWQAWQARLEADGIDPARATAVRLAVDGWWLARLVGLAPPGPDLHRRVYAQLVDLVEGGA